MDNPRKKPKRRKERYTQAAKEIYAMTLKCVPQSEIAKKFNITARQVQNYVKRMRERNAEKMERVSVMGKIADYDQSAKSRKSKLWDIVKEDNTPKEEMIRAIKELRNEDSESIKREQMVGILPKDPSPLISVESTAKDGGDAENKVQINIIAPNPTKKIEGSEDEDST